MNAIFFLICRIQCYLVVPFECIQEAHPLMSRRSVDKLVNLGQRERILGTGFVQISEVYTDPPLSALLLYHDRVRKPCGIKDLLDCSCFY